MMMDNVTATDTSAQDISNRVEEALFGGSNETELTEDHDDVVADNEEILLDADDTDSEDGEGSEDLDEIANEEELTLAGYLGIDEDRLIVDDEGQVSFNAVIDGEQKAVPLSELAKSYQLQGHVNNKSIALETERKEFEEQRTVVAQDLQSKLEEVSNMTKMVEQQLLGDFNSIDWDRLRVENPSEWSALRQEYAEKAQNIQRMQSQISAGQKELSDKEQLEMQNQQQDYLKGELSKMIAANPTWADNEVMKAETGKLKAFLTDAYGFTAEEFQYVTDHRLIGMIQDAQAYRSGKKNAQAKKDKKLPKFLKPGVAKGNSQSLAKARAVKANKAAVKKNGSVQNVANALLDRM
jgi:type I site-specific restriction endonuclease